MFKAIVLRSWKQTRRLVYKYKHFVKYTRRLENIQLLKINAMTVYEVVLFVFMKMFIEGEGKKNLKQLLC